MPKAKKKFLTIELSDYGYQVVGPDGTTIGPPEPQAVIAFDVAEHMCQCFEALGNGSVRWMVEFGESVRDGVKCGV